MDTYMFEQEDGKLLECEAVRLCRISTERPDGLGSRRWHHLQLLKTIEGQYVAAVQYISFCPGEQPKGYAWRGDPDFLLRKVKSFEPAKDVKKLGGSDKGFLINDIKQDISQRFQAAVKQLADRLEQESQA